MIMTSSQTSFGDLYDRLEIAFSEDDLARANRLAQQMDEIEPLPVDLIDEFIAAIRDGEYEKSESILEKIGERYDERESAEGAIVERSVMAQSRGDVPNRVREPLHEHVQLATSTEFSRASFLLDGAGFLENPEIGDDQALLETAEELRKQETEYKQAEDQAASASEQVDLPPAITILSTELAEPLAVETAGTFQIVIGNIGDDAATGVQLNLGGTEDVVLDPTEVELGKLGPDSSLKTDVTISAEQVGSHRITIEADADNASTKTDTVTISAVEESPDNGEADLIDELPHIEEIPEWLPPIAGAGALGASGYAYLRFLSDRTENEE